MKKEITEVQIIEPIQFEATKPPKKVKLKFPFLDVPVEMNQQFFKKILNNQRYKIVSKKNVETQ